ncbi:hypothetical protein GCM10028826_32260 [Mucilaginibacter boryungensis]
MSANLVLTITGTLTINSGSTLSFTSTGTTAALAGAFITGGTGLLKTTSTNTTVPLPTGKTWSFDVEYAGATQKVVAGTYNGDLTMSGTNNKTALGDISVGGVLTINTSRTLAMGTNQLITVGSTSGAGTLTTGSTDTAPIPTGATWAFNVTYTGTTQNVSGGTYNNDLTLSAASGTKTVVGGDITISSGNLLALGANTLDMGANTLSLVTTPTGTSAAVLKTASTATAPIPAGITWPFEIDYTGTGQNVVAGTYSGDLNIGGSGTQTGTGTIAMGTTGNLTVNGTLNMATFALTGTLPTIAGTGLLQTANTSATPIPTGKTWTFEVEYNGAAQTVMAGTYNGDLTVSGTGTSAASGAITMGTAKLTISSTLNMGTNQLIGSVGMTTAGSGLLQTSNISTTIPIPTAMTWSFNVEYKGATVALVAGTYSSDLTLSGTAAITMKGAVTVGGDFHFGLSNAVLFHVNNATSNALIINGDLIATAGDFDFNAGASGTSTVTVKGNFSNTAAKFETTGNVANGILSFAGTGTVASPQTFTNTTPANLVFVNYQVQSGTVLQLNSDLTLERETSATFRGTLTVLLGGTLNVVNQTITATDSDASGGTSSVTISSGATLITSNSLGIPGSIPVTNATISYNSGANYEFDGTAASVTGTFTTTPTLLTVNNLTINTTNIVTASQAFSVSSALNITGTLNMGTNLLSGVSSNTGTGTLETQATATAIPTGKAWTVGLLYDATSTQSIVATTSYNDISFAGTGNKTFPSGTTTVNGDWNSASGIKIDLTTNTATVTFGGSSAQALTDVGSDSGTGVVFKNVNFSGGGTKTMGGTGKFSVSSTGLLTMSASTQLVAGGLLWLKSDASGSAMVATMPSGASITGDVYAERYLYGNNDNTRRGYRLLSSTTHDAATSTYNVFNLKQNIYITGTSDALPYDATDATKFDNSPNHGSTIYHYYEAAPKFQTSADFKAITLPLTNDEFQVGEGIYLFYRGLRTLTDLSGTSRFATTVKPEDNTLVFKGTLNQGTYTVPLSYTYSGDYNDGYNLVGNPYPATLDVSSSITFTGTVDPFIYELDPTTKAFCTINKNSVTTKTGNASQYIASGQGFFVKAQATGASITFNESGKVISQQLSQLSTPRLLMSTGPVAATQTPQVLKLKMINPADSTAADDIAIAFESNGKTTYDGSEDAFDLGGNGTVALSSFSSDNIKLAINTYPSITLTTKIKLGAVSLLTGNFNMVASNLASLDSKYQAKLIDNYKTDTIKLSANSTYAFSVDRTIPATYADGRFEIVFAETPIAINQILSFSGIRVKKNIDLTWKVNANPVPVKFTLEKSTDNVNFSVLTNILSDSRDTYSFSDDQPVKGDNYYRLGQTDINNHFKYADTINVKYKDGDDDNDKPFKIYPQPVLSTLNIALGQSYNGEVKVKIMDLSGQIIKKDGFKGTTYSMDLSKLYLGAYIIELSNENQIIGQAKFIKQ